MKTNQPIASLSIDLDNLWSYLKVQGDQNWKEFPSYLEIFIPSFIDILDSENLSLTFFIVGQDAALEKNKSLLKEIVKRGHEVGNHSFNHEPWLHQYTKDQLKKEVLDAEDAIIKATGQKPIGFRGPGYSWSPSLLQILKESGYLYDSTIFPTYIGPLARLYYNWKSPPKEDNQKNREKLFGSFKQGLMPLKPYLWEIPGNSNLLEMPITTIPIIKFPFHMSYLIYLSSYSEKLMHAYLSIAIKMCKLNNISPNFLIHPTDILGGDKIKEMNFFPGMNINTNIKQRIFREVVGKLKESFELVNVSTCAKLALQNTNSLRKEAVYEQ